MSAKLWSAWLTTTSFSFDDPPETLPTMKPLYTSFVASCTHSFFLISPKMMQIFCETMHVLTNLGTFLKCMSIILRRMRHLSFNMPNARSAHTRIELWTKFQWYSSPDNPSLWPLNGESIHGRQGYATSPIKTYAKGSSPRRIIRFQSSPTNSHRVLTQPNLCRNPKITFVEYYTLQ